MLAKASYEVRARVPLVALHREFNLARFWILHLDGVYEFRRPPLLLSTCGIPANYELSGRDGNTFHRHGRGLREAPESLFLRSSNKIR